MTRAIRRYAGTFTVMIAMAVAALATVVYVIEHEGFQLPLISPTPFTIQAAVQEAKAITPGQGQTVRVAGVQIGVISGVRLADGHAVVTMNIQPKFRTLIHTDATALVRPKTGLDDMFVELNPGNPSAPLARAGYTIPLSNTLPYVDTDQVLAGLDGDTRQYLQLLLGGAAQGLQNNAINLRDIFRRFGPTHQDLARFAQAVATRRSDLRQLIHSLYLLNGQLAQRGPQISRLVNTSAITLHALAGQQQNLSRTVHDLPAALQQTTATLNQVRAYADLLGPTATRLGPVMTQLNQANYAVRPFAREATPIIRTQIRPFVTAARPLVRNLRPASQELAAATPPLTRSFVVLNHLFNMLGYDPTSGPNANHGFLYWLAWLSHQSINLFSTEDANGNFRPLTLGGTCSTFESMVAQQPVLEYLLNLTPLLTSSQGCNIPPNQLPPLTPDGLAALRRARHGARAAIRGRGVAGVASGAGSGVAGAATGALGAVSGATGGSGSSGGGSGPAGGLLGGAGSALPPAPGTQLGGGR